MRYETTLSMINFILTMLIHAPENAAPERILQLTRIRDEIVDISPTDAAESNRGPYKTYSLACATLLLDEFFDSIPSSDYETKAEVAFVKSKITTVSRKSVRKKLLLERHEERPPSMVR